VVLMLVGRLLGEALLRLRQPAVMGQLMAGLVLGPSLLGALFLATGVLASSMTENQIVAAFLSFGLLILVWLLGAFGGIIGDTPLGNTFSYVSFIEHYDRLVRGLVEAKDLMYYASGIVLMLFLAHRVVESQRWK